ncbi:unnamed protein product [Peniophora sp. CBMAI 1063]|nr:unnamed protein product [Peniophora sp. CBMAI 1063]
MNPGPTQSRDITNVLKLYRLVEKGEDPRKEADVAAQSAYYHSGIGTYKRSFQASVAEYAKSFGRSMDMAIALSFKSTVIDAYTWLSETYRKGDRIFLFSFSRGAYQARTLSAMIDKVGLVHRNNEWQIPLAYQLYANADTSPRASDNTETFKEVFSRDVRVHFVGAWDTVSSVGLSRGELLPKTVDGMTHVCHFRHALALDERRVKFLPEYAHGGERPSQLRMDSRSFTDTKEVWFAGTHSDVGGGTGDSRSTNRGPALDWMLFQAESAGLRFQNSEAAFKSKLGEYQDHQNKVNKSLDKWFWWLPEYLPLQRLLYMHDDREGKGKATTRRPHRGEGRVILPGQTVHPSVWMSKGLGTAEYTPHARARLLDGKLSDVHFWRELRGADYLRPDGTLNEWKELYVDDLINNLVEHYVSDALMTPDKKK